MTQNGWLAVTNVETLYEFVETIIIDGVMHKYVKNHIGSLVSMKNTYDILDKNHVCFTIQGKNHRFYVPHIYNMIECVYEILKSMCTRELTKYAYKKLRTHDIIQLNTIIDTY